MTLAKSGLASRTRTTSRVWAPAVPASLDGSAGAQHPAVAGAASSRDGTEQPTRHVDLLRDEPQEIAGPDGQADGALARPHGLALALSAEDRLEAQGQGGRALDSRRLARLQGDGAFEEQADPGGDRALPVEQAPGLRPQRAARARDAEQLPHR